MDEEIRANPHDVTALLRAGRLSVKRVALAAYLGDERARAAGVEPWVPPEPVPEDSWRTAWLVTHGGFTRREAVSLVLPWVEQQVERHGYARRHFMGPELGEDPIGLVQAWLRGERERADFLPHLWFQPEDWHVQFPDSPAAETLLVSLFCGIVGPHPEFEGEPLSNIGHALDVVSPVAMPSETDLAQQSREIAGLLLDPDWPPWEE